MFMGGSYFSMGFSVKLSAAKKSAAPQGKPGAAAGMVRRKRCKHGAGRLLGKGKRLRASCSPQA